MKEYLWPFFLGYSYFEVCSRFVLFCYGDTQFCFPPYSALSLFSDIIAFLVYL